MVPTERLYRSSPALFATDALVLAIEGETESPTVTIDRTTFYPEGGGQPCDLGEIAGIRVTGVEESDGVVLHRLAGRFPASVGDRVTLRTDAPRRLDHAQQHTGQHLLSAVLLRLFGAATVSFHLGGERCTIDVDLPDLSDGDVAEAEAALDDAVAEDYPVIVHVCPPEEISSFPLRKRPPEGEEEIRIVEIDGIDYSPCCGTHLSSLRELRLLVVLGTERYKGMTRVIFVAGARAVAACRTASRNARDAARAFGIPVTELPERALAAVRRLKALESSIGALSRDRALLEADLAAAAPGGLPPFVSRSWADRGASEAQESVRALAARGCVALAASVPDLTAVAAGPTSARLGERLKALAEAEGGKGGGGGANFRASFGSAASLTAFMAGAERELRA